VFSMNVLPYSVICSKFDFSAYMCIVYIVSCVGISLLFSGVLISLLLNYSGCVCTDCELCRRVYIGQKVKIKTSHLKGENAYPPKSPITMHTHR
jgi:hypothetical protein